MRKFVSLVFCTVFANVISLDSQKVEIAEKDWWETAVFYQIYPRSFADSDGDGVGDLKGIISRLGHLKEAGIDATWLSPVFKSPMVDFGYDISDFRDIDPIFGTIADLEELIEEAHKLGIKIILDFVPNHSSNEASWFQKSINMESGFEDFYVWRDKKGDFEGKPIPPNNWQSVFYGPAWTWNEKRKQFYLHQFASGQPDLNYRNPKVVQEMKDVLTFWLAKGVDGFRVDAINHLMEDPEFKDEPLTNYTNDPNSYGYTHHYYSKDLEDTYDMVYQWRALFDQWSADHNGTTKILMTEAYANLSDTLRYYQSADGKQIGSHFPFNFLMIENLHANSNANDFKQTIDSWLNGMPKGSVANWVLGNHDKSRVGTRYGVDRIDGLLTLVMTLPGVAVTYNGDEIGMMDNKDISWDETKDPQGCNTNETIYKNYSRDPQRTPFQWDATLWAGFSSGTVKPWLPVHPNYKELNLKAQIGAGRSHFKLYQDLSQLRSCKVMKNGDFISKVLTENVLAYKRWWNQTDHKTYVVLINFGDKEEIISFDEMGANLLESDLKVSIGAASSTSKHLKGAKIDARKNFILGANDAVVVTFMKSSSRIIELSYLLVFGSLARTLLF